MKCEICLIEIADLDKFRCKKCQNDLEIYLDNDQDSRNYAEFLADHRDKILYILVNERGHYVAFHGVFEDQESAQTALINSEDMGLSVSTAAPRALREKKRGRRP